MLHRFTEKTVEKNLFTGEKLKRKVRASRLDRDWTNAEMNTCDQWDDQAVIKFHGMYQQDDRDQRDERAEKNPRSVILVSGSDFDCQVFLTPAQWIATHEIV